MIPGIPHAQPSSGRTKWFPEFRLKGILQLYNLFGNDARLPHNSESVHFQPTLNYPETELMLNITYRF